MPSLYPTFKCGTRAYASHIGMGAGACWQFDEPVTIRKRYPTETSPYRDQPAYVIRFQDGAEILCAAESLSDVPVSYPHLTWLEVLDARGLPRPAGF